ncbi:TetR/AcrR family transcriptional regulator [Sphingomonas nostoxanthinifaciens]|uniref:TetR/AcrR family transcriptional regulator n=1 Tax=Sphingomonas nostoxanthinifaciens TaxID=2872652 RepID=UPI001CC1E1ED|nr:TetR/AcrR family transcriptional regulator [Sphingomonas nostoxanthinifaciens]UAK24296.1 TetR/AcrR family transcriptional regulator [Sphingomonas nostoxanthinifaciens]
MEVICSPGRREARKADRRRAILDVAERSFLERGYADTSMSTIAAELGGSKTTLWSYFPSKEELFAAVLDSKIDHFRRALDEALLSSGGTAAALRRFGQLLLDKVMSPSSIALNRLIVAEAERFPSIGETFATRGPDRVRERLAEWMRGEMASGRMREGDPAIAARQFIGLCQAGCYFDRLWRPQQAAARDQVADIEAAVETFLHGWASPAA